MVERVRAGGGLREAAREFHVSLSVIQRWVRHAAGQRLDRVDWSGKTRAGLRPINRTERAVEVLVVAVREQLAKVSDLGEHRAEAIHATLLERASGKPPSVRTIGRIIERSGVLDAQRRVRRAAPPIGWYLPEVAARRAERVIADSVALDLFLARAQRPTGSSTASRPSAHQSRFSRISPTTPTASPSATPDRLV